MNKNFQLFSFHCKVNPLEQNILIGELKGGIQTSLDLH